MWEDLVAVWEGMQSTLGVTETLIALVFSLVFSIVCFLMYQLFYGSRHIGAGVHRMFLVGGPAITVLFLGIQTSIPLSLGLLGALSFVRFRTPVKDPAEIGFVLLLIASSIGASTGNFLATTLLFVVVFGALGVPKLVRGRRPSGARGSLMLSVPQGDFERLEGALKSFLATRLRRLRLESMSVIDGKVNLQYQYKSEPVFDWTAFANELNRTTAPTALEIFVG